MLKAIVDRVKRFIVCFMTQDTNLSQETEQFSFIRTITVEPDRKNNLALSKAQSGQQNYHKSDRKSKFSSVLSTRNNTSNSSSLSIDPTINSPITISNSWYSWDTWHHSNNNLTTVIVLPESATKKQFSKPDFNYYLDRIFLIFAGGYLCLIFWWLCLAKNAMFPLTFLGKNEENITQADADFLDYMKRSLEIIDNKVSKTKILSEKKTAEVGYVPVYTPSSNQKINSSLPSSQSNTLQSKDVSLPLLPPPPPLNQLAINPPISAIPIKPPAPPVESVPIKTTPAKTVKSTPQTVVNSEIAATSIKPNLNHVLVGVMELNENSAALFKINGVTQKIWLGDRIESTGWVLESVANQKATISREGKSLTINVGENF